MRLHGLVPNLQTVLGGLVSEEQDGKLEVRRARVDLVAEPWLVRLEEAGGTKPVRSQLGARGGFGVTHLCEITRRDQALLTLPDVEALEEDLSLFFSFLRGFACSPICIEASDSARAVCWRDWTSQPQDYWRNVWQWLPMLEPQSAGQLFPGFMARRADARWRRPIQMAIHWYVSGNTWAGGAPGAVVLVQAALEMLAWEYVNDSRLPKTRGQSRQHASDKIRSLLSWAGIPASVPAELASLRGAGRWHDAPHALSEVRNAVVHPDVATAGLHSEDVVQDAWRLAMELLELLILRLSDYRGRYHSRVHSKGLAAETSPVPWAI